LPFERLSKEWRSDVENFTWEELCFEPAGGLANCLGEYSPSGGWRGFYKMLTYCPGLLPTLDCVAKTLEANWLNVGHVKNKPHAFSGDPGLYCSQSLKGGRHLCISHLQTRAGEVLQQMVLLAYGGRVQGHHEGLPTV
jgi:hypothetical protein